VGEKKTGTTSGADQAGVCTQVVRFGRQRRPPSNPGTQAAKKWGYKKHGYTSLFGGGKGLPRPGKKTPTGTKGSLFVTRRKWSGKVSRVSQLGGSRNGRKKKEWANQGPGEWSSQKRRLSLVHRQRCVNKTRPKLPVGVPEKRQKSQSKSNKPFGGDDGFRKTHAKPAKGGQQQNMVRSGQTKKTTKTGGGKRKSRELKDKGFPPVQGGRCVGTIGRKHGGVKAGTLCENTHRPRDGPPTV